MALLQIGCPFDLQILATCEGGSATEQYIHLRLLKSGDHVRGEWFRYGKEALVILELMRAGQLNIAEAERQATHPLHLSNRHKRVGAVLEHARKLITTRKVRHVRQERPKLEQANDQPTTRLNSPD